VYCFYQKLVLIAEYHVHCWQTLHGVCCDEFPVPHIDRKSKQVKTVTWKILFAISKENNSPFQTPKISKFVDE